MDTAPTIAPVTFRDPRTLKPHPINRPLPRLRSGMPEWDSLVTDIQDHGVREPVWITEAGLVVDGETRRQAAVAAGLASIPCRTLADGEVLGTIREKLVLQKHLSKGQRAYVLYPLLEGILAESRADGGRKNLRIGVGLPGVDSVDSGAPKVAQIAEAWGFGKDLFFQAAELHAIFRGDKVALKRRRLEGADCRALREKWEPLILDLSDPKPIGLGAALAGIAGEQATGGQPKGVNQYTQAELFGEGLEALTRTLDPRRWSGTRPEARQALLTEWRKTVPAWDADVRREMAAALLEGLE